MKKIKVLTPIVELDGDETARVIWKKVKDILLNPYLDLNIKYFDLCLENREFTQDIITSEAAEAVQKNGIGVKCATIYKEDEEKVLLKNPTLVIQEILSATTTILDTAIIQIESKSKKSILFQTSHGVIHKYFNLCTAGEDIILNPLPTIYVWVNALKRRAELEMNKELEDFVSALEKSCDEVNSSMAINSTDLNSILNHISQKLQKRLL